MVFRVTALALALAALANAQSSTGVIQSSSVTLASSVQPSDIITNTASVPASTATSYPINPGAVPLSERQQWCVSQQNACREICSLRYVQGGNTCVAETLTWNCQCSEIPTPDLARFNGTIPYWECVTYKDNCVAATDDAQTQQACLAVPCGGPVAAADYASSSSSATMMTTATATSAAAGTATPAGSGNAAPAQMAQNLGLGVVVAGAALFGLAL